ncbi:MAG: bifunctional diaminohydroxyphosphoribosylaminopyrimidine deaminase/5-amino-6-(5-phosphoribosylamino)uracil reductase RibD [Congregibacter sp.]
MFSALDHQMMARAIQLAEHATYWARPNPHVGCVLLSGDTVVGEGFTSPAGGPHAEVNALAQAGAAARGATAYVTLEPCAHEGRTGPCATALIEAGVARVVAALEDPHARVSGRGFQMLDSAGVATQSGLMADAVERQLAGFLLRQRRGRGRVRAKLAMSLDGRTAMASGESQWITGAAAREDVQKLRAASCAILTGVGTVLHDDCALTVRDAELPGLRLPEPERRALRVVLDSQLRTPPGAAVLSDSQRTLVLHADNAEAPEHLRTVARGLPTGPQGVDLSAVMGALNTLECNEILVESGPSLAGALFTAGLIDELIVYLAPRLLGSAARPLLDLPLATMAEAYDLVLMDQRQVGRDLRLTYVARATDQVME